MQKTRNGAGRSRNLSPKNAHADTLSPGRYTDRFTGKIIQMMNEFSSNKRSGTWPVKLKFRKIFCMSFPGFANKG